MTGPFKTVEDAVRAGFKAIMADNNKQEYTEYGFFVVMKVNDDHKGVHYCYTDIEGGGSGEITITVPNGQMVRAHCHTHPKRTSTGNFSTHDKSSFVYVRSKREGIAFYLLNPQSQIRVANDANDFPAGRDVSW